MDTVLFPFPPNHMPNLLNPLVLAYVGDAVYEVYVRQYLVSQANQRPHHLHRRATSFVSAKAQAQALQCWLPLLTDEETGIVKRGRNAHSGSSPKNTDILVYRHSTGFEALIGYLFYTERHDRLQSLMRTAVEHLAGGSRSV
jgi:ribonuclease-3 family protein